MSDKRICPYTERELPSSLAGYQNVVIGNWQDGDILVYGNGEIEGYAVGIVGTRVSPKVGFRCYRKIPVAKQGDLDHPARTVAGAVIEAHALKVDREIRATDADKPKAGQVFLPDDAAARKEIPLYSGCIAYFPNALLAVAQLSKKGNDQHNPGKPLHWDRSKSGDEPDALMRHLVNRGKRDKDGVRESTKVAWRALAMLEKEIEAEGTL